MIKILWLADKFGIDPVMNGNENGSQAVQAAAGEKLGANDGRDRQLWADN